MDLASVEKRVSGFVEAEATALERGAVGDAVMFAPELWDKNSPSASIGKEMRFCD